MNVKEIGVHALGMKGGSTMQYACAKVATLALKLKRQYRAVLSASSAFGRDKTTTQEIDALGQLIKELEDAVVVLQIKLEPNQDRTHWVRQGAETRTRRHAEGRH